MKEMVVDQADFFIFGYGSLIFDPEYSHRVVERVSVVLPGYSRRFNKISRSRSCLQEESFNTFEIEDPRFVRGVENVSIVLGTEACPGKQIVGVALGYLDRDREQVLTQTDRREGFNVKGPSEENGYVRYSMEMARYSGTGTLDAYVYLSNPERRNRFYLEKSFDLSQQAQVLINATPQNPRQKNYSESRGLYYLEHVRSGLRGIDIIDPELEALAEAVRAFDGPWRELIAPGELTT